MQLFNLSATLNASRLCYNPALCLPHATVRSFDLLTIPFPIPATIKGVVLDKDNCFAKDHDDKVWPAYNDIWTQLKKAFPKENLLIVSNSAGTDDDVDQLQAASVERNTGVSVLQHSTKKPGCHQEILEYFKRRGISNDEIVVIGDRLFTDMLMANMMGSWGIWLSDGVEQSQKIFPKLERSLYQNLVTNRIESNQWKPPIPMKTSALDGSE